MGEFKLWLALSFSGDSMSADRDWSYPNVFSLSEDEVRDPNNWTMYKACWHDITYGKYGSPHIHCPFCFAKMLVKVDNKDIRRFKILEPHKCSFSEAEKVLILLTA